MHRASRGRQLLRLALLGAGLLLANDVAVAAPPPWLCSLSEDSLRLVCVADTADAEPGDGTTAVPAPGARPATTAVVHGTAYPLDPARVYTVELLAPATDAEWLEQLARATLCYRSPGCTVLLGGLGDLLPPLQREPQRVARR
jgi:hypothetical protein